VKERKQEVVALVLVTCQGLHQGTSTRKCAGVRTFAHRPQHCQQRAVAGHEEGGLVAAGRQHAQHVARPQLQVPARVGASRERCAPCGGGDMVTSLLSMLASVLWRGEPTLLCLAGRRSSTHGTDQAPPGSHPSYGKENSPCVAWQGGAVALQHGAGAHRRAAGARGLHRVLKVGWSGGL